MTLRQHRKANGLTQKELGAMVGVQPSCIVKYENGMHTPSPDMILKLTKALHLTHEQAWQCFIERK